MGQMTQAMTERARARGARCVSVVCNNNNNNIKPKLYTASLLTGAKLEPRTPKFETMTSRTAEGGAGHTLLALLDVRN